MNSGYLRKLVLPLILLFLLLQGCAVYVRDHGWYYERYPYHHYYYYRGYWR